MIWFTSDLHLCHNKEFIYKARGFNSVEEMNDAIINLINLLVEEKDDLYILGDVFLNDYESGIKWFKKIECKHIHIILGNHDYASKKRLEFFDDCPNVVELKESCYLKYDGYTFYLSHYPTITYNLEDTFGKHCLINLHGHTHFKDWFYYDLPFCFNVGVDANHCCPINIESVIACIKSKVKKMEHELKEDAND